MCLWVIGDYVLDLVIEIDLRDVRVPREEDGDQIRIEGDSLVIPWNHRIVVDVLGNQVQFVVAVDGQQGSDSQRLKPGDKYVLLEKPILLSSSELQAGCALQCLRAIPRKIAWGGGGINLVNAVRDISPPANTPDVMFTAIAPHWRVNYFTQFLPSVQETPKAGEVLQESAIQKIVELVRSIGPDVNIVEWALARQRIHSLFLRDGIVEFLLSADGKERLLLPPVNLVISRVRSGKVDLKDKIILKAPPSKLEGSLRAQTGERAAEWRTHVETFVASAFRDWTFPVLNSVKDRTLMNEVLAHCQARTAQNRGWYGLIAMTDSVQGHLDALLAPANHPQIRSWHLVFNEGELTRMILRLWKKASEIDPDRVPLEHLKAPISELVRQRLRLRNASGVSVDDILCDLDHEGGIQKWGELISPIRHQVFYPEEAVALLSFLREGLQIRQRIYVTLGSVGSLCLDSNGEVWFAGVIEGPEAGHDTTGLGDCWAAAVTLLEYHAARAARRPNDPGSDAWREFYARDFLKVATAVAHCKFTNPAGRVFLPDLIRVLKGRYIPVSMLFAFSGHAPGVAQPSFSTEKVQKIREAALPARAERAYSEVLEGIIPFS